VKERRIKVNNNRGFSGVNAKKEQEIKDNVMKQYNCGHSCRICPYPGAKCRVDDAVARKIQ